MNADDLEALGYHVAALLCFGVYMAAITGVLS